MRLLPAPYRLASPGALHVAVLLAGLNLAAIWPSSLAARCYALAFLLVVPGAVLLSLTPHRPKEVSVRIAWSLGTSMLLLMALGLLYSLVLPHLGVTRPLGGGPVLVGVDVVMLGAIAAHGRFGDPLDYLVRGRLPRRGEILLGSAVALVPIAAAAGAERLDNGYSGTLSLVVLVVVGGGLAALLVLAERVPGWLVGGGLYAATAGTLLLSSMRTNHPYGYDIQTELQVFTSTLHAGIWHVPANGDAYASMLSITVLPAVLSSVTKVSAIYLLKVCYPLVFSVFPVLTYAIAHRWFSRRAALVGAVVVVVQGLFTADITGLARQEVGLVYFALFLASVLESGLARRWRQAMAVAAFAGMAISHYSTAYFAAIVVAGGYVALQVLRRIGARQRQPAILTFPVVALCVGAVTLWNVVVTHSAQNVANVTASLASKGLDLLPGPASASLLQRFLNADVTPSLGVSQFAAIATRHWLGEGYIHPYAASLTARYPVLPASVPGTTRNVPSVVPSAVNTGATIASELVLVLTAVGVLAYLWRARRGGDRDRAELAAMAIACLALLGVLRLSGTVSSLYNAPRGQVQGAPLLSVGLALVCAYLFSRRRGLGSTALGATTLGLALLLFTSSGLSVFALGGGGSDILTNYGEAYQRYDITDADMATASWVIRHQQPGQLIYADVYASLQLYGLAHPKGLVTTLIPQVLEPGAYVYASSTNVVDRTARSLVDGNFAVYRFPAAFLQAVKDVVFTTGTTEVYR